MEIRSSLKKLSEIAKLIFYVETTPIWPFVSEERERIINKYRHILVDNRYFKGFVEPLVLRLYDHASHSKHVKRYPCAYKGTTFVYTIRGHIVLPILTMGSPEQLYEVCKKECVKCPTAVYTPALLCALIELSMFEAARLFSKTKNKIEAMLSF